MTDRKIDPATELEDMARAISEALQLAWNDWVEDTGCFPECFKIRRGKLYADFKKEYGFLLEIARHLMPLLPSSHKLLPEVMAENERLRMQLELALFHVDFDSCSKDELAAMGWVAPNIETNRYNAIKQALSPQQQKAGCNE